MADRGKLTRLLEALGADDPQVWADSEAEEDIPQLARYRLLRALAQDIRAWNEASIGALGENAGAEGTAVGRALELGVTAQDLSKIARLISRQTTFNLLYRLADPDSDDLQPDLRKELPGWVLVETTADGTPTHRPLDALHEDLLALAPTDDDCAEGPGSMRNRSACAAIEPL